jgi:membrane protein YdbS with pleckstrin-like domain
MMYQGMNESGGSPSLDKKWRLLWLVWSVLQAIAVVFAITGFIVQPSLAWFLIVGVMLAFAIYSFIVVKFNPQIYQWALVDFNFLIFYMY